MVSSNILLLSKYVFQVNNNGSSTMFINLVFMLLFDFEQVFVYRVPDWHLLVLSQQWKHQKNVWNLFKFNNKRHLNDVIDAILVDLLFILNRFHTLFWCFHCWFWTSKCRLQSWTKHLRLFHFLARLLFTTSETELDYYDQKVNVRVAERLKT